MIRESIVDGVKQLTLRKLTMIGDIVAQTAQIPSLGATGKEFKDIRNRYVYGSKIDLIDTVDFDAGLEVAGTPTNQTTCVRVKVNGTDHYIMLYDNAPP